MKTTNGFCLIPWFGIFIDSKTIGPCCVNHQLSKNINIDNYLKSSELNNLKKDFLNGEKPSSCNSCWEAEAVGIKSVRQEKAKVLLKETKNLLKNYCHFSIRISNKCNYKCRMCGPRYSSAWELDLKASSLRIDTVYSKAESFDLDSYKKNIQYIITVAQRQLTYINILGGEPLISDEFLYFLEKTKENNVRQNIILNINTNLSVTSYKDIDYKKEFSTFKSVILHASLDGLENVGEYIRRGFKQSIFDKNLQYFKEYIRDINVTLQIYNIYNIPNIYSYADYNNLNVTLNYLIIPRYLSISLLDEYERNNILKFYKNNNFYNKDIESSLYSEKINLKDISKFINYTNGLDSLWKTDLKKNIPELKNWYERIIDEKYSMVKR